jgi:hypothetical protein
MCPDRPRTHSPCWARILSDSPWAAIRPPRVRERWCGCGAGKHRAAPGIGYIPTAAKFLPKRRSSPGASRRTNADCTSREVSARPTRSRTGRFAGATRRIYSGNRSSSTRVEVPSSRKLPNCRYCGRATDDNCVRSALQQSFGHRCRPETPAQTQGERMAVRLRAPCRWRQPQHQPMPSHRGSVPRLQS